MENTDAKATLDRLKVLLLTQVFRGDQGRRVIEYLIGEYGSLDRICAQDISEHGGPQGEKNVCPLMSRMRDELDEFFLYHPLGRAEQFRLILPADDRGNYSIRLGANDPPKDLVAKFWCHHLTRTKVPVVYAEVPCAEDGCHYSRSQKCRPDLDQPFNYESVAIESKPLSGLVSAAIMRATFRLMETFAVWGAQVTPTSVRPVVDMIEGDIIAVGTPASMPRLLSNCEAAASIRTDIEGVTAVLDSKDGLLRERYLDTPAPVNIGQTSEVVRWGVVTRHHYRFQRTITVIAAKDELAVEAIVQFLTNEELMLELARKLSRDGAMPDHFQALFCVRAFNGHSIARQVTVEKVLNLCAL